MKKVVLLCSFLCFCALAIAQESLITDEVKTHMNHRVENGINVGIVLAYIDGDVVEYYSAGYTDLTAKNKVDKNTIFEIGSISKTFTTTMLAIEVEKGTMSLSDPIVNYFPKDVKVPTRKDKAITLKDLATHSSAIPRMPSNFEPKNLGNPFADYTIELAYEFMSSVELTRDIGELYEYSNYGMGMLGHILELKNHKSYEALLIENIANVCDMPNTRVVFTDNMKTHLAKGHSEGVEVENWDIPALAGAGGIRSSARDMVNYVKANMSKADIPLKKAMKMTQEVAYKNELQNIQMGLGWHHDTKFGLIAHNGATGGYTAFTAFNPETNQGVVVLTNSTISVDEIGLKLLVPTFDLKMPKKSLANHLEKIIDKDGVTEGIASFRNLKASGNVNYDYSEGELNNLGYRYLGKDNLDVALVIFKLNVEIHPKASNPYDSLGEAYLKKGDTTLAITNYKKSLELNPANDNAVEVLSNLDVMTKDLVKDVKVAPDVLETYVGEYQLAPTFSIVVTTKEGQLFVQATGQPQFEIFPKAQNEFYLKVVEASVTFNADENGNIASLTLYQNGQHMPGNKVK